MSSTSFSFAFSPPSPGGGARFWREMDFTRRNRYHKRYPDQGPWTSPSPTSRGGRDEENPSKIDRTAQLQSRKAQATEVLGTADH